MSTITEIVVGHAEREPDRQAFVFLPDPGKPWGKPLTYGALDRDSRSIASWLADHRAERVLLLYPPGLDFVRGLLGCLYAGAVAVPSSLPEGHRPNMRRVARIVRDAELSVILTDSASQPGIAEWLDREGLTHIRAVATDVDGLGDPGRQPAAGDPDALALLQYTSGSTSEPKGVMISHQNLVHNASAIGKALGSSRHTRFGGWLPHYHDLGLMGMLLQPLYHGGTCVFMSPMSFLKRPHLWLETIDKHDLHMSGGPNFAYELCTRRLTDQQIAGLDLSRWRVAVNGAEPVRAATLREFARRLAPAGFRERTLFPCYGMAEATLLVCGDRPDRAPVIHRVRVAGLERGELVPAEDATDGIRELVSSGRVADLDVRVIDPVTSKSVVDGRVGEIWLRGGSVAVGYWRQEDATRRTFQAVVNDEASGENGGEGDAGGGYLRTGDLGVIQDGELYVTGRIKDVLVVQGRNLYPQDIEGEVRSVHPAFAGGMAAAFGVPDPATDGDQVVVVHEIRSGGLGSEDLREIAGAVTRRLGRELGIGGARVLLTKPGTVRRTTSGKVQRSLMRELYLAGQLEPLNTSGVEGASA